jgi:hypothetical protein
LFSSSKNDKKTTTTTTTIIYIYTYIHSQNLHFFHFAPCLSAIVGKEITTALTHTLIEVFTEARADGDIGDEMDIVDFIALVEAFDKNVAQQVNAGNSVLLETQVKKKNTILCYSFDQF